jgi:hypothetical protein
MEVLFIDRKECEKLLALKIISTIRAQLEDKEFTVLKTRIIFLLVE